MIPAHLAAGKARTLWGKRDGSLTPLVLFFIGITVGWVMSIRPKAVFACSSVGHERRDNRQKNIY